MKRMVSYIRGFFKGFAAGALCVCALYATSKSTRDALSVAVGDKKVCNRS